MSKTNNMTVKGFLFSTVEAAIKKPGRKDLALIYSERDAVVSGMFTTNKVKAAPVLLDMQRIRRGKGRAIIVNSGNANACTGSQGMKDALEMTHLVADCLRLDQDSVFACSTGVIGAPLPMERIRPKIIELAEGIGSATIDDVAGAIMTTDTFPKISGRQIRLGKQTATIMGVCKGAGMISPCMATMLGFIMTDAVLTRPAISTALKSAVKRSFNKITIDGDMSTNDTVLLMANGCADNTPITQEARSFKSFSEALSEVAYELASMIARDGEGMTKFVKVLVRNAKNEREAEKGAFAIANSLLVKTALCGNDANWGRIMTALGYAKIQIREDKTDIFLNRLKVASRGLATGKDKEANELLKNDEIEILVDLHLGKGSAKILTCDLTEAYVKINAEYRT